MSLKIFQLFLALLALRRVSTQLSEGVPCETPDGEYGNCVNLRSCTRILNLIKTQGKNPEIAKYLRQFSCGQIENAYLVCCAQNQPKNIESLVDPVTKSPQPSAPETLPRSPRCGHSNSSDSRVVNGVDAKLGEFPWIAALGYRNSKNPQQPKWLCGGSLITKRHILTAAHCVNNRNDLYLARVGELDLYSNTDGAHPEDIPLIKARIHEDYSAVTFINDIAILTMEREPRDPTVIPICLPIDAPLRTSNYVSTSPTVAGWGSIYFRGPSSAILQMTHLPIVKNDFCKRAYANKSIIDDRVLCAGFAQGGTDACEGDSGGPLMFGTIQTTGTLYYLVGVVSYGFRCAEPGYPGVYTRVTNFIDWIQRNVN